MNAPSRRSPHCTRTLLALRHLTRSVHFGFFIRLVRGRWDPSFARTMPERDRLVAVKLFTLDLPPERVHQLVAEFERLIAADLTHPALAAPLATGIHGVSAYLAQEFVAADSLDLVIREYGAAPAVDALRVAAQLAGALDFAAAVRHRARRAASARRAAVVRRDPADRPRDRAGAGAHRRRRRRCAGPTRRPSGSRAAHGIAAPTCSASPW